MSDHDLRHGAQMPQSPDASVDRVSVATWDGLTIDTGAAVLAAGYELADIEPSTPHRATPDLDHPPTSMSVRRAMAVSRSGPQ